MAKASDFVQAPAQLLAVDRPLEADLYIYLQLNNSVVHFRQKGDALSKKDMDSLAKVSPNCVLILRACWSEVMAATIGEISLELERGEKVDTPSIRAAARTVLVGLGARPAPGNPGSADAAAPTPQEQAELARTALAEAANLVEKMLLSAKKNRSLQAYEQVIQEWKEEKNPLIAHHRQVSAIAVLVLLVLGNSSYEEFSDIGLGGLVHDLGLLGLPQSIMQRHLMGAENFNPSEKILFMKHADATLDMIKSQGTALTPGASRIIQLHHEHWDGSGFKGMKGAQIFRPARVLQLADGVVARLNNQGHEGGIREAVAAVALEVGAGGGPVYDPDMVAAFAADLT